MIVLDTNILARVLLNDDPVESPMARELFITFIKNDTVYFSPFVAMELIWLMQKQEWQRQKIVQSIIGLLHTKNVFTPDATTLEKALEAYACGKADFPDYLILFDGMQQGAKEVATFDTVFAKEQPNCHHPEHWL